MSKFILVIAVLCLSACGDSPSESPSDTTTEQTAEPVQAESIAATESTAMAQWARSCALCHVNGEGGAPVVGDKEDWQPRLAQGEDMLLKHTIEGFNNMPPLGYCMDCEEDSFLEIIRFMGGES
jgi:cytochrome c5